MFKNKLTKENILSKVVGGTYELMNYYLKPYTNGDLKKGNHISNPLLEKKQKTPSFNIYDDPLGIWKYKDFATGDSGDVFDLVMKLKKCSFKEALVIINNDFALGLQIGKEKPSFEIQSYDWDRKNLDYWSEYGIYLEALTFFNVLPIKEYSRIEKKQIIKSTELDPIFAYRINFSCYKIYRPFSSKYKFLWLGYKPNNYVFGFEQLPKKGERIFITGGEKDVISLHVNGEYAVSLNSETAMPSEELINKLKSNFEEVIVLYDIDSTGITQSKKICDKFGLKRMVLPEKLKEEGGKDISDFFKFGFKLAYDEIIIENYEENKLINNGKHLSKILETQKELSKIKSKKIIQSKPILFQLGKEIIFPNTINIIQGKAGVHKSRLAETICSSLIKKEDCKRRLLQFTAGLNKNLTVCYVDTERNLTEQYPYALQQILNKAGFSKEETPRNFDYISLLEISRAQRFEALREYLELVRLKYTGHTVIVLDVVTDCIKDFNRSDNSMELIDLMNIFINQYDVTFICLIHENPGSADKARGHLGTELFNKSSTAIQIGFEMGKGNKPSDIIALKFLKKRSTKRYDPIHLIYSEEEKGLVLADANMVDKVKESRLLKAEPAELIKFINDNIEFPVNGKDLIELLSKEFECSSKIIRERLNKIIDDNVEFENRENIPYYLIKKKQGREVVYDIKS
ncbi:toprim domain-containing protein [Flavivirga eckloniae]|uniref:Zinc finger CHC2-type domain-containing protein n=1 Tax=Flavivirga eckloniae TaxID=1803846 RepID=A0A2K9PVY1_9FLAO|nr:toprim domain-containing protein [Flavivirga eckloniae]AUP81222.1 hypothetical protein C1H87_21895 [Flavivirga eckloniae]